MKISYKKGFTLIELLVVIAIISILTAIVMANFNTSKMKARDSKRVSDLAQIQLALELYFDRCNSYPVSLTVNTSDSNGTCAINNSVKLANYIAVIPTDPVSKLIYDYGYTGTPPTDYVLRATLETNSSSLNDSYNSASIYNIVCLKANLQYCVRPK